MLTNKRVGVIMVLRAIFFWFRSHWYNVLDWAERTVVYNEEGPDGLKDLLEQRYARLRRVREQQGGDVTAGGEDEERPGTLLG